MKYESHVLWMISRELRKQESKWGEQNHEPLYWLGVITEELGEVAKALIESGSTRDEAMAELIHTAACCVNAIDSIMRSRK